MMRANILLGDTDQLAARHSAQSIWLALFQKQQQQQQQQQNRKFGKQIQKRQLEIPEYWASFVNYKALKKLIKKLSATPTLPPQNETHRSVTPVDSQAALQANKATFFFQLERELDKVNACYLQKEAELKIRLKTLLDKKKVLQTRHGISRRSSKFTTLQEGFQQFATDLNKLQQFVEVNGTAFSKILKKWDKTSKSKTKELYLSRAVEVQPFFNATVISELSDQATTSLQELGAWSDGIQVNFQTSGHVVTSQHFVGTDEGDADTLLLDTVVAGNLESLRDLLIRMQSASVADDGESSLMDRVTRTFLTAIHDAPRESLQVLLDTGLVDLHSYDDINERNCLHQATIYGKQHVLEWGLNAGVAADRTDVYGRVPLHYACLHGRLEMLEVLLRSNPRTIDLIDHDNFTPLIHTIRNGHLDCVQRLLSKSARIDPVSVSDHAPLNLACEHGSEPVVELLLKHGAKMLPDAEGLFPQHLVARAGKTSHLLLLLKQYGADLDLIDKLYGWTPLVHAASEGNVDCLQALLKVGVDAHIVDEKGLPAMYYAAWEGHLECMKLLFPFNVRFTASPLVTQVSLEPMDGSSAPGPMSLDPDAIPVLELPPPIIPLRRYGHNFLDTKTVVQINFEETKEQPLIFFQDGKYPAARLTISSKVSDLIPKNIILPFQEDTRIVSFQVDNIDTFSLDFDVFPTYGAKVIAKTVVLPSAFKLQQGSSSCCLPLFDPRLRAIGQISFTTQVIKPFQGQPLEITDFETYWKATSQFNQPTSAIVTGSSLSGDYVRLFIQYTSDGAPVVWPQWTVACGGLDIPVCRLSLEQFLVITAPNPSRAELPGIPSMTAENVGDIYRILATAGVTLTEALSVLPLGVHVNLQILYPSPEEEKALALGPALDVNVFADSILTAVFDHARAQRAQYQSPDVARSMVFSSYSPRLCTALNWKQPNFPVFLCNDLGREQTIGRQGNARRSMSVKEAVRIAQSNNFMGLMCHSQLLEMVPALVDAIKSHGLALVMDRSTDMSDANLSSMSISHPPTGVDGVLKDHGILRFNDSIDM
ncbi:ankyrin repeats (3 copies) domain-containing protein [Hirsutella rhossiliensis]|uniref:Ankyrin repeats (3 copies) domain-containing protein n=1 Tax=Hirsutella rhossiliensis TaxID=111463 RepID=A0A9P8N1E7_9HYPO|nr:ankyrin repeats (3 copies) domain-containing protein [Hirsutella rhossiliensis]KAH0966413.1 ankyrin repeats (3 copies) domain-containing protein [Hirsutella rhossiliensis]